MTQPARLSPDCSGRSALTMQGCTKCTFLATQMKFSMSTSLNKTSVMQRNYQCLNRARVCCQQLSVIFQQPSNPYDRGHKALSKYIHRHISLRRNAVERGRDHHATLSNIFPKFKMHASLSPPVGPCPSISATFETPACKANCLRKPPFRNTMLQNSAEEAHCVNIVVGTRHSGEAEPNIECRIF